MIEAVLFDWSNTLVHFEWDEDLVVAGHRAALGKDDAEFTNRWHEAIKAQRPYAEILRELGVEDPDAFIDAEHEVWQPATTVLASAQALLESLRARGVKTGVVARAWPEPARVLRADAERLGLAEFLDVVVFSEDGGEKPFAEALGQLGVEPSDAMYVGDKLVDDVQGASNLGMTTVQALWFVADDTASAVEPDFMAFTPMDVLNAVRRLAL
jgi:putative hydrolase of the HAD superfamily